MIQSKHNNSNKNIKLKIYLKNGNDDSSPY